MASTCFIVTLAFDIPHSRRYAIVRPSITRKKAFSLAVECFPAVLAAVASNAVVSVARQVFGLECGEEALGIYASVATPAILIQAAAGYLYSPMIGELSRAWYQKDRSGIVLVLGKMLAFIMATLAICSAALCFVGPIILPIAFGASISDYLYLLPYVLICTSTVAIMWLVTDVLIVFRKLTYALLCNIASLIGLLLTIQPTINAFYMNGVNIAISSSYLVGILMSIICIVITIRNPQIK